MQRLIDEKKVRLETLAREIQNHIIPSRLDQILRLDQTARFRCDEFQERPVRWFGTLTGGDEH